MRDFLTEGIIDKIDNVDGRLRAVEEGTVAGLFSSQQGISASPYNLTDDDGTVFVDASGGIITINLPLASGRGGRFYVVKRTNSGGSNVTVAATGADTIDNGVTTSVTIASNVAYIFQSDGASIWYLISTS